MPPKAKAQTKLTREALVDCYERMEKADAPAEKDFNILIEGASSKSDPQVKLLSAQLIPRYAEKFPEQMKTTLSAMEDLSKNDDPNVRLMTIKGFLKLYKYDEDFIIPILVNALGDSDEKVVGFIEPFVMSKLESDDDFKSSFFKLLPKQKPETQCIMVRYIKETVKFTTGILPKLIETIQVAFKSCVVEGLKLYARNRKLIPEDQAQPLIGSLLELLDNSLESNFDETVNNLLVQILKFTRIIGSSSITKLLNIITTRVMPCYDSLPTSVKIVVLQKIADVARDAENEELLNQIYNKVFLKFPKGTDEEVNFTIIEATLFAFYRLAQRFTNSASKLIGTVLVQTGQPDEADGIEDPDKQSEYQERLESFIKLAESFGDLHDTKYKLIKKYKATIDEESKKQLKESIRAHRVGSNVHRICRKLLRKNPLTSRLKITPSWAKKHARKFSKTRERYGRRRYNNNRRRTDKFRSYRRNRRERRN
ncbi:API5-domain-containing protein [Histomonas meleagridis]|uniref:API5-domain-containing protein n=1 Tax=Histomonas meleagridis TaxID=135588 RepID=UPI0035595E0A|nr:API5-domain-containing protein [Histomonas meleagridis]KAH0802301.1 API5-domain-containing protein [Histomonas meleagridis]